MNKGLIFLLCSFFLLGTPFLQANECANIAGLTREIRVLARRLELVEKQQREVKQNFNDNTAEILSLRKEIESLKTQPNDLPTEFLDRIETQQKILANTQELGQLFAKYGNNPDGMSTLHAAIKAGDIYAVNLLLANGADINSLDQDFAPAAIYTALSRAVAYNQVEIAQLLINSGADVNLTVMGSFFYPIYYAAEKGTTDLVTLLINSGAMLDRINRVPEKPIPTTTTPLHIAAKAGNYEAVTALVNGGAKVDGNTTPNKSASHWNEGSPLDWAAANLKYQDNPQNLELIKFLVEHGAERRCRRYYNENGINYIPCPTISGYLSSVNK